MFDPRPAPDQHLLLPYNDSTGETHRQDDHFLRCWRHQDCDACTESSDRCGWCPYSSSCIPVSNAGLLSPLRKEDFSKDVYHCPYWRERYEFRTAALLLIWGLTLLVKRVRQWSGWGGWQIELLDEDVSVGLGSSIILGKRRESVWWKGWSEELGWKTRKRLWRRLVR
ncbi:hypothetical protein EV356DRAFT_32035 [Viridothelium virens]|uniref:PSI domain-containing protein n=1 Tax=Viridothelium virens TaxID=1048519 RepID=A0A6A6GU14_VIRVR|nr:hypothetical protein EV356DRAFT_32035 [Viridothelium virens]